MEQNSFLSWQNLLPLSWGKSKALANPLYSSAPAGCVTFHSVCERICSSVVYKQIQPPYVFQTFFFRKYFSSFSSLDSTVSFYQYRTFTKLQNNQSNYSTALHIRYGQTSVALATGLTPLSQDVSLFQAEDLGEPRKDHEK